MNRKRIERQQARAKQTVAMQRSRPQAPVQDAVPCFLGILYPAKRIMRAFSGEATPAALAGAARAVIDPAFWEGIDTTQDPVARTMGRLVEIIAANDAEKRGKLISMLAVGLLGMCRPKFFWIKVEESKDHPPVPEGKVLEAAYTMRLNVLKARTIEEARRLFKANMEVGLALDRMWLIQEHEFRPELVPSGGAAIRFP